MLKDRNKKTADALHGRPLYDLDERSFSTLLITILKKNLDDSPFNIQEKQIRRLDKVKRLIEEYIN